MTVGELIKRLKSFPKDLPVAYSLHSEYTLMEPEDIHRGRLHPARVDGWVHSYAREADAETVEYLLFPGN